MAQITASFTPAAKGISVLWTPDPSTLPFRRAGADNFSADWALGSGTSFTMSGYIAAALRWKAEQFSQAYLCVKKQSFDKNGRELWEIEPTHSAIFLLRYPCGTGRGDMTRVEFMQSMAFDFDFFGEGFARQLRRASRGYTEKLQYLPYYQVRPRKDPGSPNLIDYFEFTRNGVTERIEKVDMVHWKQNMDPGTGRGVSPLRSILKEVLTEKEIASFHYYVTGNKGLGNLFVTPLEADTEGWEPDEVTMIQAGLDKTKGDGRGNSIVLDRAAQVKELGSKGQDMVLDKVNLIGKEKVFAVLNVDPAIVHADLGYQTSKGTDKKQQSAIAWSNSLLPLGTSLCERLTLDVLQDFGRLATERIDMDVSNVWALQDNEDLRHGRFQKDFMAGILSQNEARAGLGYGPAEPGEHSAGERYHPEFPQMVSVGPADTLMNGTNGQAHNEENPQPVR